MITFGSGCSGIEAASVAWEPIGFKPVWFSQFDPEHDYSKGPDYPSAVLQHHWPHIPNLGDLTAVRHQIELGYDTPDVFVAGTPCQAYSVAGKREGLADERGALTLEYVKILDTIDEQRKQQGKPAAIGLWENVPGVLSSKDNAFGCFLGDLAGEDCELFPPGKRWSNAGCVFGPKRTVAWRVIDAQYFGVAQRRRRVFVVASAREGFDPVELLFEFEGLRRDSAPSREAGSVVAALTANGVGTCGADDNQGQAGHLIPAVDVCPTLRAGGNATGGDRPPGTDVDTAESLQVVMTVHGTQDPDTNLELAHTLGRNQGQENAVFAQCVTGDITHTLKAEGFDASEDVTGRGQPIVPVAFSSKDYGGDATENMSPTLRACGHTHSHANAGAPPAVAYSVSLRGREGGATAELGGEVAGCLRASSGGGDKQHVLAQCATGDITHTLKAEGFDGSEDGTGSGTPIVPVAAFAENSRAEIRLEGGDGQITGALSSGGGKVGQGYPAAMVGMAVRRLTPVECERLQGFPDGYTDIPYRGKPAADGHRYKALGNSKAIPVVAWLGKRIKKQIEYSEFDNL